MDPLIASPLNLIRQLARQQPQFERFIDSSTGVTPVAEFNITNMRDSKKEIKEEMDKKIRDIEKKIKKDKSGEEKALKDLEKADKKRDKVCDYGEKMMKKKKHKKK